MAAQRKTLGILRIEVLSSQACMNLETFEALIASLVLVKLQEYVEFKANFQRVSIRARKDSE